MSAKPTALEAVPTGQPGEKEHASTFLVPVQHYTGTSQCGSSLAIPLRVSDEWHRCHHCHGQSSGTTVMSTMLRTACLWNIEA